MLNYLQLAGTSLSPINQVIILRRYAAINHPLIVIILMDLLTIAAGTAAVGILAAAGIVLSLLALPRLMNWQTDSLQVVAEKKNAELEYGSVRV